MIHTQAYPRLALILLIYGGLGLAQIAWLPLGQAPDEIDHFRYIQFIARTGRPPLTLAEREEAGRKSYLPPLFHGMVALLAGWSDGPPHLKFLRESPRFDLARAWFHTEGLVNTEDEAWPYRGEVLLWQLSRGVSLLIGAGVIGVTFLTALEIFPGDYRRAVAAAALIALTPTFIFISATASYESLVALVNGLYFWQLVKILKGDARLRSFIRLGLLIGLAVTAKYVGLILPVSAIAVVVYLGRGWLKRLVAVGLAAVLAASWWFGFLLLNFNEVAEYGPVVGLLKPLLAGGGDTTMNYTAFVLTGGQIGLGGEIARPSFWAWAWQFYHSFWVQELGRYPLGLAAPVLVGAAILVSLADRKPPGWLWPALFAGHIAMFLLFPLLRFLIQGELSHTAQGRHLLFPVATILPLVILYGRGFGYRWLVGGLAGWSLAQLVLVATYYPPPLPVHTVAVDLPPGPAQTFGAGLALLGSEAGVAPGGEALDLTLYWRSLEYLDEDYWLEIHLLQMPENNDRLTWRVYPADGRYPTRLWEPWETIRDDLTVPLFDLPPGRYRVELQVVGSGGPLPVQSGGDRLPLAEIMVPASAPPEPEIALPSPVGGVTLRGAEQYRRLDLPEYRPRMTVAFVTQQPPEEKVKWWWVHEAGNAYPTQPVSVRVQAAQVGPEWPSGAYRLRAEVWREGAVVASRETASLLTVFNKEPRPVEPPPLPYRVEANFADRITLLGYDLPARPGEAVPVTLSWQARRTMGHDYTFFVKLLDAQGRAWSSLNREAKDGYKTTHWLEREVVTESLAVPVPPDAPPGIYHLDVGIYLGLPQGAIPLPLVVAGQPTTAASVALKPLKIGGPPAGVVVAEAAPQHPLAVELGEAVRLLGYDLARREEGLALTLYWQSRAELAADQTVFVHLRNEQGEIVAQMDHPPAGGVYPTSLWSPGEIIPDEILAPLPADLPPGRYTLAVGMYDFSTGLRLPIAGTPDDTLILTPIEIP